MRTEMRPSRNKTAAPRVVCAWCVAVGSHSREIIYRHTFSQKKTLPLCLVCGARPSTYRECAASRPGSCSWVYVRLSINERTLLEPLPKKHKTLCRCERSVESIKSRTPHRASRGYIYRAVWFHCSGNTVFSQFQ